MDSQLAVEAADHSVRLWLGLEDVKDVMIWADGMIAASPNPSMAIIDLSSAFRESRSAVLARLRTLTSTELETKALRMAVPDVARLVRDGVWSVTEAIESLKGVAVNLGLVGGDIATAMFVLEDSLALAADGIFTESQLREHFFEALERILGE
jgi:hypothetical protein